MITFLHRFKLKTPIKIRETSFFAKTSCLKRKSPKRKQDKENTSEEANTVTTRVRCVFSRFDMFFTQTVCFHNFCRILYRSWWKISGVPLRSSENVKVSSCFGILVEDLVCKELDSAWILLGFWWILTAFWRIDTGARKLYWTTRQWPAKLMATMPNSRTASAGSMQASTGCSLFSLYSQ